MDGLSLLYSALLYVVLLPSCALWITSFIWPDKNRIGNSTLNADISSAVFSDNGWLIGINPIVVPGNIYNPHIKDYWKLQWGRGTMQNILKESMKLNWNLQWGGTNQKTFCSGRAGGVGVWGMAITWQNTIQRNCNMGCIIDWPLHIYTLEWKIKVVVWKLATINNETQKCSPNGASLPKSGQIGQFEHFKVEDIG